MNDLRGQISRFSTLLLIVLATGHGMSHRMDVGSLCKPNSAPEECPPWFMCTKQSRYVNCTCASNLEGMIKCDQKSGNSTLSVGQCMTYDSSTNSTLVGQCLYSPERQYVYRLYAQLPPTASELNNFTCNHLHREGLLCAQCKSGYGPSVFTQDLHCYKCSGLYQGWGLYLFFELFFATSFFLIVILFRISATKASMNSFVLLSQIVVAILSCGSPFFQLSLGKFSKTLIQTVLTFYGIWNLDFFRQVIPSFCVSHKINNLHLLALQYISAFYPLCLITIAYFCVELHDRNFRPFVWFWQPFHWCFARFRQTYNSRASIIEAFATYLLLSYSKLIFVSASLLDHTRIHNLTENTLTTSTALLYEPTVHSLNPLAIISIIVFSTFITIPPLLLILYPTKAFQKCLGCCKKRWHALDAFADAFQGCYKDGTGGTYDCRYFAGLYFLLRIALFLTHTLVSIDLVSWIMPGIIFLVASLCFAVFRPYKNNIYNNIDCVFLAMFALTSFFVPFTSYTGYSTLSQLLFAAIFAIVFIPLLYMIFYVSYNLLTVVFHHVHKCWPRPKCLTAENGEDAETTSNSDALPDRIINPDEYRPLLSLMNTRRLYQRDLSADNEVELSVNSTGHSTSQEQQ